MRKIFLLAFLTVLLLTAGSWAVIAQDAATYVYRQPIQSGGSVDYTLTLESNGRATLVSRQVGDITVNRQNLNNYGDILTTLDRYDTVNHTGTWHQRGNSVEINLNTLRYDSRTERETSRFLGTIQRGDLYIRSYDRDLYGNRTRFVFDRRSTPGGGGGGPSASIAGTYRYSIYDARSRSGIAYTLILSRNGRATLIGDRRGDLPVNNDFIGRYGQIVRFVDTYGRTTQTGNWTVRDSRVLINLDTLRYGDRTERQPARMVGTFSRNRIDITRYSTNLYGTDTDFIFGR